jgi:LDH2 family malate/lactate/ureidoglycolate dehydrogenase
MLISFDELEQFVGDILVAAGVDSHEAQIIATVLVWNELVGRSTQGLIRIPIYLKRLQLGLIKSPCNPEFDQVSDTIHMVKGNDGFGQFLGHCAMSKATELAEIHGVGVVGVLGSNHFGSSAYYLQIAAKANQLSLVTSNSVPKVAPYGGMTPVFGTNPIAFGAPTKNGQSILIDFSTGALAGSTIRKAIAEHEKLPVDAIIDENEKPIVDPNLASQGVMLPLAGARGYCLGLMAEILSSIITGAAISHEIGSIYKDFDRSNNVGHFFLAIDISRICPLDIYFDRLETLIGFIKKSKKRKGTNEILLPGETRWRNYAYQRKAGIKLTEETIEALYPLVKDFNLSALW